LPQAEAQRSRASLPARFGLHVFADDRQPFSYREALNRGSLGFYAEAKALPSLGGDSKICDGAVD
jgi:hypothetical protein